MWEYWGGGKLINQTDYHSTTTAAQVEKFAFPDISILHRFFGAPMTAIDDSKRVLKSFDIQTLDSKGLGRWDEEYYLAGLYHPLGAMTPAEILSPPIAATLGAEPEGQVDIYIHVPFCHVNCSFCHFYKEIIPRNTDNGLEALYIEGVLAELETYTKLFQQKIQPRTIQFGGGTPSALSIDGLTALLAGLRARFDLSILSEVKFEFHPDMANDLDGYRKRLRVLRDFGLTTAIIDLEATDAQVLKSISRGNTSCDGFKKLINIAAEEGIPSIGSAYITGLPCETLESFEKTLRVLTSIRQIDAINLYPLMFKPSDAVFRQRKAAQSSAPGRLDDVVEALLALELLSSDESGLAMTAKGKLRNAEIMFYLSEVNAVRWNREDSEFDVVRRYEFFPDVSRDNQVLFEKYLASRVPRGEAA